MNEIVSATLFASCTAIASGSAFAADEMKNDSMGKDAGAMKK